MERTLEELTENLSPLMRQFIAVEKSKNSFLLDKNKQIIATRDQNIIDIQLQVFELYPDLYEGKRVAFVLVTPILIKSHQLPSSAH
jgi:hypothetical protein